MENSTINNKMKMTKEEMAYPRQFTSIIEANTNFYSHTGDGGNACFASNCDSIEKVWLDGTDWHEGYVSVNIPKSIDFEEMMKLHDAGDIQGYIEYVKPVIEFKCTTVEEIIEAFNKIENNLKKVAK